jgi:hypothetical protein
MGWVCGGGGGGWVGVCGECAGGGRFGGDSCRRRRGGGGGEHEIDTRGKTVLQTLRVDIILLLNISTFLYFININSFLI